LKWEWEWEWERRVRGVRGKTRDPVHVNYYKIMISHTRSVCSDNYLSTWGKGKVLN